MGEERLESHFVMDFAAKLGKVKPYDNPRRIYGDAGQQGKKAPAAKKRARAVPEWGVPMRGV